MSNYNNLKSRGDLVAYTITSGTVIPLVIDPKTPTNTGCTLGVSTYYFPFGSEISPAPAETSIISLSAMWAAAVAGTGTIEATNIAATIAGAAAINGAAADLTEYDSTSGWVQIDPTLTGAVWAAANGASNSMAKYTLTLGGVAAGSAIWNIPTFGFKRFRFKLVTTVGGIVRATEHGKVGA